MRMQPTPLEIACSMVDVAAAIEDGDAEGLENWGISGYGRAGDAGARDGRRRGRGFKDGDCGGIGGRLERCRGV